MIGFLAGTFLCWATGLLNMGKVSKYVVLATAKQKIATAAIFTAISIFYLFSYGTLIALNRSVHECFPKGIVNMAGFSEKFPGKVLNGLRWGDPTTLSEKNLTKADVLGLIDYLKARNSNLFVFPDFTILYAILNVPSPQPILWFHKGLTYPIEYSEKIDSMILINLMSHNIKTLVISGGLLFSCEDKIFSDFPLTKNYLQHRFDVGPRYGIFQLYLYRE